MSFSEWAAGASMRVLPKERGATRLPQGTLRFGSITELRLDRAVEQNSQCCARDLDREGIGERHFPETVEAARGAGVTGVEVGAKGNYRNIVFACEMARDLPWHVVNLVSSTLRRQADEVRYSFVPPTEDGCCYLHSDSQHCFIYRTWEDLHAALIQNHADLERLDQYLRNKSAHYRRAFALVD